jgi:polar amino acid transport system substrate-binding protein
VHPGAIDAYASTALGNRILADRIGDSVLEAVEHGRETKERQQNLPLSAFSFNRKSTDLLDAVSEQLRSYLGTYSLAPHGVPAARR